MDTSRGRSETGIPGEPPVDLFSIVQNMNEVLFLVDSEFRSTLYVSQAYEKLWGRTCASLYANPRSFLDSILEEDRPAVLADIARVQLGEERDSEYRIRCGGGIRWILTHASPVLDASGKVTQISGIALDITERQRDREARRESDARFRLLCDSLVDGIIITENGIILEANGGLAAMLGYELSELIGREATFWVAPESAAAIRRRMSEGIEGRCESGGVRKDGSRIMVEATARMLTEGGRRRRVTALRDITEKRKLEDQFRQAQKMEAVGRLAGGVAHDFNNLLTVITSYSDLVSQNMTPSDPRRLDMAEIRKAADTAATLTRQLLAFSRQQVVEPRCLALEEVVANAGKLLRRLIGEDIELIGPSPSARTLVRMDPGQLEQIIMNLAVNARDAMPAGGILSIETATVNLDQTYAGQHAPIQPGTYAMLAVTDTGCGMTPEIRSRIFEPFFTTKEASKGTGLGLATVYGIVKQNGGCIWVYSEPGRGTTFKIYVPLVSGEAGRAEESRTVPPLDSLKGQETVLLVEDSAGVRGAARQILLRQGYKVLECPDGEAALNLLTHSRQEIHLLLTDVVMPVMNGRELAARVHVRCPGVRTLYMSGYPDQAVVEHGLLPPGTAYLQKPFSPQSLASKVRSVLDAA